MKKPEFTSRIFEIFQANSGLIAKVLRRFSLHQVDIADICQETILRALEAEKRVDIIEPKSFLVGIAKNIARAEIRRRAKLSTNLLDDLDPDKYVSNEPLVDEVVASRQKLQIFGGAVALLPPQCQKVFILQHVHGATHQEIAAKLDMAISTVEKHVALGLKRCREALENKGLGSDKGSAERVTSIASNKKSGS
jgi:RNA polymerase sigma-70 factor (ECF subfamily)